MYQSQTPFIIEYWLYILLAILLLRAIFKKSKEHHHSHWNTLVTNFKYSPKEFYKTIERNLRQKNIGGMWIGAVYLYQAPLNGTKRIYLQVDWEDYRCNFCCAPYGDGMFFSNWVVYKTSVAEQMVQRIPLIGNGLHHMLFRLTYYKVDTASMFMTYCHQAMLETIDQVTEGSGVRISEDQRKPILEDVFKR